MSVDSNPVAKVKGSTPTRKSERGKVTVEQVGQLLASAEGSFIEIPLLIAATTRSGSRTIGWSRSPKSTAGSWCGSIASAAGTCPARCAGPSIRSRTASPRGAGATSRCGASRSSCAIGRGLRRPAAPHPRLRPNHWDDAGAVRGTTQQMTSPSCPGSSG